MQNNCLHCLKSHAKPETKSCVNATSVNSATLFTLSEEIIDSELVLVHGFIVCLHESSKHGLVC